MEGLIVSGSVNEGEILSFCDPDEVSQVIFLLFPDNRYLHLIFRQFTWHFHVFIIEKHFTKSKNTFYS